MNGHVLSGHLHEIIGYLFGYYRYFVVLGMNRFGCGNVPFNKRRKRGVKIVHTSVAHSHRFFLKLRYRDGGRGKHTFVHKRDADFFLGVFVAYYNFRRLYDKTRERKENERADRVERKVEKRQLHFGGVDNLRPEIIHKAIPDHKHDKENHRAEEGEQKMNERGTLGVRRRADGTYKRGDARSDIRAENYVKFSARISERASPRL